MYYGPNYDTSSASVSPPVLLSAEGDKKSSESDGESQDDDDDDDWITPDNLHRVIEQMGGATTASAKGVAVGCLTTDFSMQVCTPVYNVVESQLYTIWMVSIMLAHSTDKKLIMTHQPCI